MDLIINEILKNLKFSVDDEILFDDCSNKSMKIKKKKFHEINITESNKKIAFIDGGNFEIIKTPSLSLFFNRVYYCTYQNNKRINKKKIEFYSLITSNKEKINCTCFPQVIKNYEFNPFDKNLITSNKRIKLEKIGNLIRRLSELNIAKDIPSDFVVLDGSLDSTHEYEKKIISNFENVAGLSKTTNLITKNGLSVGGYLNQYTDKKNWYYNINENLFFVKLHKNSKYVFKLEYNQKQINELFSLLINNSKDPVFLGYPYGLVEADRFARVSKQEADLLKIQIRTKLKENFKQLEPHLNSLNSHDILDNIS